MMPGRILMVKPFKIELLCQNCEKDLPSIIALSRSYGFCIRSCQLPVATILPSSNKTTWSARRIVERRWVMTTTVITPCSRSMALWMRRSFSLSSGWWLHPAKVASVYAKEHEPEQSAGVHLRTSARRDHLRSCLNLLAKIPIQLLSNY